ncbi:MAG: hypothetical protein A2Z34_00220 [Planctomycetes bacterium RBG_16_59_8]|nr:MAG: hypothetical protein A2Z34_00220 [Planctomycetes bacterium RBG_16_59_8]
MSRLQRWGKEAIRRLRHRRIRRRKERAVRKYLAWYSLRILIETGTYRGDMVEAMKRSFDRIYSIELDPILFEKARLRFKDTTHVSILHGDSGEALARLLPGIHEPVLFWLDAHYSEGDTARGKRETPIVNEIGSILSHPVKRHVILIDDARCFAGENDYPTVEEIVRMTRTVLPDAVVEVRDDIIRIYPG